MQDDRPDQDWLDRCAEEAFADPEEPDAPPPDDDEPDPGDDELDALAAPSPVPPPSNPDEQGADVWHTYDAAWLVARPHVETPMLCPRLELGRGRPCGLVGAAGAGKNDVAQMIALAVASGAKAWGSVECTKGRVLHISYDLGRTSMALRYRRLANGLGIAPSKLAGQIEISDHPKINLCTSKARLLLAGRMKGFDLVLIDNLRSAAPEGDENSSEFGHFVTLLGEAAADAGSVVLYLHHTGKDGLGAGRGTGAIQAASGTIWNLSKDGGARKLQQERQHDDSDDEKKPLWIVREKFRGGAFDVGARESWKDVAHEMKPKDQGAALKKQILAAVAKSPRCSANAVVDACKGGKNDKGDRRADVLAMIKVLISDGALENVAHADQTGMALQLP
jgi:hypothetical protein